MVDYERFQSKPEVPRREEERLPEYPRVRITKWDTNKTYGFGVTSDGERVFIHVSNVNPYLDTRNEYQFKEFLDSNILVFRKNRPKGSGQLSSVECVWGEPLSDVVCQARKRRDSNSLVFTTTYKSGGERVVNHTFPPGFDASSVELGAAYRIKVYTSNNSLSKIGLIVSKVASAKEYAAVVKRDELERNLDLYRRWVSERKQVRDRYGSYVEYMGELPRDTSLKHEGGGVWSVAIDGKTRDCYINRVADKLVVESIYKVIKGTARHTVDSHGDVGQAIGGDFTYTSTDYQLIDPPMSFTLPESFVTVIEDNDFTGATPEKIRTIKYTKGRARIPFLRIMFDGQDNPVAFWSRKHSCWKKFSEKNKHQLDEVREYEGKPFSLEHLDLDSDKKVLFEMIWMANTQGFNLEKIAPWFEQQT